MTVATNKVTNPTLTSDWQCSNCGAELLGVNNAEVSMPAGQKLIVTCACASRMVCTRNEPKYKANAQRKNLGGGSSFPGG
jgi:hypothetical protein